MTKLLQEALEAVQSLPEENQDAIAALILEELSMLADKAREERRAGRADFKVLEWLREVRDKNAKEEEGMSDQERLRRTREGSKDLLEEMLKDPRNSIHTAGEWRKRKNKKKG